MELDMYWVGLMILVPCVGLVVVRRFVARSLKGSSAEQWPQNQLDDDARRFRRTFLQVYLLVMGSDWLQGPYMYTLLRDEKKLPPHAVAILYTVTYSAAAVSAPCTGYLADRFGRRSACLAFCAIHSLAALSVLSNRFDILVLGRIPGGTSMTLLWTAFESWMVTEHNSRQLRQSAIPLDAMFGIMTVANCITAIMAGVLAHCIVLALGSKTHPFVLGLALDSLAAVLILWTWNENYGAQERSPLADAGADAEAADVAQKKRWGQGLAASLGDWRVGILSLVSCCFEGTMFLFMFYWPGALQAARDLEHADDAGSASPVPYGVVFANFMGTMVIGALLFHILMRRGKNDGDALVQRSLFLPTSLLAGALLLAGASFVAAALVQTEVQLFLSFLVLEACNGVYVPSIAYQRGRIISDSGRASVYGLMRIPLFMFVIAALLATKGGGDVHRFIIFILCSAALLMAAVATLVGLRDPRGPAGFAVVPETDSVENTPSKGGVA